VDIESLLRSLSAGEAYAYMSVAWPGIACDADLEAVAALPTRPFNLG
jgi:hypothetical protein